MYFKLLHFLVNLLYVFGTVVIKLDAGNDTDLRENNKSKKLLHFIINCNLNEIFLSYRRKTFIVLRTIFIPNSSDFLRWGRFPYSSLHSHFSETTSWTFSFYQLSLYSWTFHCILHRECATCNCATATVAQSTNSNYYRWIFCQKNLFFPSQQKNCEKISPYFHLQKWKIIQIALFWEIIAKISIFWGEIGKI